MNPVDKIVNVVLYEGYALYPYSASSTKNQQRFTFGRVYPQAYTEATGNLEPCTMQTECVAINSDEGKLTVSVRFLRVIRREIGKLAEPIATLPKDQVVNFQLVPLLEIDDQRYEQWQEAVEQHVDCEPLTLQELSRQVRLIPFDFPASCELKPINDSSQLVVGLVIRQCAAIQGSIELSAQQVEAGIYKITVRIHNTTSLTAISASQQDAVLMQTMTSTHTILTITQGDFISQTDPPDTLEPVVASCRNEGTWPVLVGEKGSHDTLLSSPIILYNYPEIAPESPGDLFDATEIDEILTLRVMTLTEAEKQAMSQLDERTREILQRSANLTEEQLLTMHGTLRQPDEALIPHFDDERKSLNSIAIDGSCYQIGSRVRLQPKRSADIVLAGCTGIIEAVEQDFEQQVYLAVVMDDDPGKEFGLMRQVAHRFFYSPDEVVLLQDAP